MSAVAAARAGSPTRAPTRANSQGPTGDVEAAGRVEPEQARQRPGDEEHGPRVDAQEHRPDRCPGRVGRAEAHERSRQVVAEVGDQREQAHDSGELERREPLELRDVDERGLA